MTKWFDTNYHYLVPELGPETRFRLVGDKPVAEYREAKALGIETRPVVVGPVTFLLLAKAAAGAPAGFRTLDLLDDLVGCYAVLLTQLAAAGAEWVQLDEPALARNLDAAELDAVERVYQRLGGLARRPKLLVATYFGDLGPALRATCRDRRSTESGWTSSPARTTSTGSPRSAACPARRWSRGSSTAATCGGRTCRPPCRPARRCSVSPTRSSCRPRARCCTSRSTSDAEQNLDPRLKAWLAFARQKVDEVVLLGRALNEGRDAVAARARPPPTLRRATTPAGFVDDVVRARLTSLGDGATRTRLRTPGPSPRPASLGLPPLPTTTIGSFPQTDEVRQARAAFKAGSIDEAPTPGGWKPRSTGWSRCRRTSGWTCWCTANPSATTWCSTSPSGCAGTPRPSTAGCSPTAPATSGRRSCSATSPGRNR